MVAHGSSWQLIAAYFTSYQIAHASSCQIKLGHLALLDLYQSCFFSFSVRNILPSWILQIQPRRIFTQFSCMINTTINERILTLFPVDVIEKVDGIFDNTIADIAIISACSRTRRIFGDHWTLSQLRVQIYFIISLTEIFPLNGGFIWLLPIDTVKKNEALKSS